MFHRSKSRAALVILAVSACWALPAAAQTVSPTDYKVPVSTAEQLRVDVSYKYAGREKDVLTNDGTATLLWNRFYNSLPYSFDLNLNIIGDTKRLDDGKQDNSLAAVGNAGVRKYFNPDGDWFYSAELGINFQDGFDRPSVVVVPGIGYGRFIRVTALARAVRIDDFLIKERVIKGHLPAPTMIKLANIIENEGEYQTTHGERYKRYWFEAMEAAIQESGMFTGDGLGAVGVLRTEEVLFEERVNERFYGWDVRFGMRLEVLSEFQDVDRDDPGASFRARYFRPLGWKSQFGLTAEMDSPFTDDFGTAYSASGAVDYIYEIGNRIDFTANNLITTTRSTPGTPVLWTDTLRSGFIFYLENQVNLIVTGNVRKERGTDLSQGLDLALGYRFK